MMTASVKSVAKAYAEAGYKVLPLYPIVYDEDTGEYHCTCKAGYSCGRSSGKHPLSQFAPNGVFSATDDLATIETWPDHCNIGFSCTSTVVAIDIDVPEIAQTIIDSDRLHDLCVVQSRRGLHLYVQSSYDENGLIYLADGTKIGEVRAAGQFTVLPPSRNIEGREYVWLTPTLLEHLPSVDGSAYDYLTEILAPLGYAIRGRDESPSVSLEGTGYDGTAIEPCDLPWEVDPSVEPVLYQLMLGNWPTTDRSGTWFRMACEAVRAARRASVDLDTKTLAGFIKKIDAKHYQKFSGRKDGDKQIWMCAARAQESVANKVEETGKEEDGPPPQGAAAYGYDPVGGFVYYTKKDVALRICNFEPRIVEVLEMWTGEENEEPRYQWVLQLGDVRLVLDDEEISNPTKFHESVQRALAGRPDYVVEDRMWPKLFVGMQHYSQGSVLFRKSYAASGWIPGQDKFLLPSTPGAITADGFDLSIKFESKNVPPRMTQYGDGVEPHNRTEEALAILLKAAPPSALVPLFCQILAAPLASLGAGDERTVVHMFGETGNLKTSLSRTIMCIYGRFSRKKDGIDGFTSTVNFLESIMHFARDLPVLIDDYKVSMIAKSSRSDIIRMIQNYADGSARGRMTRNQKQQTVLHPRCLLVTTGEDIWENQRSSLVRTIIVPIPSRHTWKDDLAKAQALADKGYLGAIGYAWISWLCGIGQDRLRARFAEEMPRMRDIVRGRSFGADHHERTVSAVANLFVVSRLFDEFVQERLPRCAKLWRKRANEGWAAVLNEQLDRSESAHDTSPMHTIVGMITEGIGSNSCRLLPKYRSDGDIGSQYNEAIGYWSPAGVYITKSLTWPWIQKEYARRAEVMGFSWQGLMDEIRRLGGESNTLERFHGLLTPVRAARIPTSILPIDSLEVDYEGREDAENGPDDDGADPSPGVEHPKPSRV